MLESGGVRLATRTIIVQLGTIPGRLGLARGLPAGALSQWDAGPHHAGAAARPPPGAHTCFAQRETRIIHEKGPGPAAAPTKAPSP